MKIQPATRADISAIAELHANSWRLAYRGAFSGEYLASEADGDRLQFWEERLNSPAPNQCVLLLTCGSQLVGFVCLFTLHHPEFGSFLNNLHVAESHLGQSYGARLMLAARERFEMHSPNVPIYLFVLESNARARRFYMRFGATFSGTSQWEPPGGGSVLLHRLTWSRPGEIQFAG
jgi:ribosomal protein S18 acetylase RimI-like enzyme